jgi:hypothetical protein
VIDLLLLGPDDAGAADLRDGLMAERVPLSGIDRLDAAGLVQRLERATGPLGLVVAGLVADPGLLADVLDDSRAPVCALVADGGCLALRLTPQAAHRAADVIRRDGPPEPALDGVVEALGRAGIPVRRVEPGPFVAVPTRSPQEREAALRLRAGRDERAVRLRAAARPGDGLYSTLVLRRLSRPLTGSAVRAGLAPNTVTAVSLGIGLLGAGLLAWPQLAPRLAGAVLLQVSLVVDCVDGEVARFTRRYSRFGAWLDMVGDRVKEYAALAALAVAAGGGGGPAWLWAGAGMAVTTYRHRVDHAFHRRLDPGPVPGLAPVAAREPETASVWLRRVLQLPIGERWLLLSVLAVLAGPRVALVAFALAGVASAGWTGAGRVLRALRAPAGAGPVDRLRWLLPGLRWALEAAVVLGATAWRAPDRAWPGYLLLALVALHGYDVVHRDPAGPGTGSRLALGHELRAGLVGLAAVAGGGPLVGLELVLAAWLAVVGVTESVTGWRAARTAAAVQPVQVAG